MKKVIIFILAACFTYCHGSKVGESKHSIAFGFLDNTKSRPSIEQKILPFAISLAIISSTLLLSNEAFAEGTAKYERGQTLFTQNCASCHLNGQNVMNPKRDLQKQTLLKYFGGTGANGDVLEADVIVPWIEKSGQHKRLFFPNVDGGKLSSLDYTDVISYIVDQANNEKW